MNILRQRGTGYEDGDSEIGDTVEFVTYGEQSGLQEMFRNPRLNFVTV